MSWSLHGENWADLEDSALDRGEACMRVNACGLSVLRIERREKISAQTSEARVRG
jgi:hypothetical protein